MSSIIATTLSSIAAVIFRSVAWPIRIRSRVSAKPIRNSPVEPAQTTRPGWPPHDRRRKNAEFRSSYRKTDELKGEQPGRRAALVAAVWVAGSDRAQHDEHDRHRSVH